MVRSRLPLLQSQGRRRCPLHPPPRRTPMRVAPHHVRESARARLCSATQRTAAPRQWAHSTWEAVDGNKKEGNTQDQGKAPENDRPQGGQAQKDQKRQKNQDDQNNAGEESAPAA